MQKCISFLNAIGIETRFEKLDEPCFLPGLSIHNGIILIDTELLTYPGDILHEAGHVAVVPLAERSTLTASTIEKREQREAEEMMAIAWSYAACVHLELDPYVVFHDEGYQGGGSYIADSFSNKNYFGVPMLQWMGMTADEKRAKELQVTPYPFMLKWVLD
ncbi:MAG: hypothetical protein JNM14_13035 [Ferruginibacter sp.]|nr:hypothetical protein [Ferruginibacter sp.]